MRLNLVDDVHEWHRWWSMRWAIIAAMLDALRQAWPSLPSAWVAALPGWVPQALGYATLAAVAMSAGSRVVKQSNLQGPKA